MWKSRLFWKLFLVFAGSTTGLIAAVLIAVSWWQGAETLRQVEARLESTAVVLGELVADGAAKPSSPGMQDRVQRLASRSGTRMTVLDFNGNVLADSHEDPLRTESHANRPEFVAALQEGRGVADRVSPTLKMRMYYVALRVEEPSSEAAVVRVAAPLDGVWSQTAWVGRRTAAAAGVVVLAGLAVSYLLAGRIIRPLRQLTWFARALASGNYQQEIYVSGRDELAELGHSLVQMRQELVRRLDELRQNAERLATVLGSMAEGVLAVDADHRIILANDASRSLLEIAVEEPAGRPAVEVTRVRGVHEAIVEAFRRRRPHNVELEVPGRARRILALRANRLPGDPCPGVVIVLNDVTELRRLENLRRDFVANVSHELKTPLASIKAYAETLRLGAMGDPEHNLQFVGRIEEQAERLHQLILDLLQIARVESGQAAFQVEDVPMAEVVDHCMPAFAGTASAKSIRLEVHPPESPLRVRADREGLRTILDNLVDNALKYTPSGGRIDIRWARDGDQCVLEVEDTGIGIAERDQARVFERFFRVDPARSRELGGTGLGLSIVKHLVQAFGGSVGLSSKLGKGSRFHIRLPLAP
jgi:two-component system phosphate regulon sensor histidine kinase PhoR